MATEALDQFAAEVEAQPGPANAVGAGSHEALEDVRLLFFGYANAMIMYTEQGRALFRLLTDP